MQKARLAKGMSAVELLVVIGVLGLIAAVTTTAYVNSSKSEAMTSSASALTTALRDARAQTLASVGASQYGVKVDADRFTFFKGSSFSSSTPGNSTYMISSWIKASSTAQTFVFERVTGNSTASGTIDVYVASSPQTKKRITVQSTGLISIQ